MCACVCVLGVSLSSDFISGFCGETEDDHLQTLSLIREVGYNVGFLFAYSMRKVSFRVSVRYVMPQKRSVFPNEIQAVVFRRSFSDAL